MPQSSKAIGWSHRVLPRYYGIFLIVTLMDKQKSFVLYDDWWASFEDLTMEERGYLITAIYSYHRNWEDQELDRIVKVAFSPIKASLDRDKEKYNIVCERNRLNVEKRWKKEDDTKNTTGKTRIRKDTKHTYSDSDSDSVSVSDNDSKNNNSKELVISNDIKRDKTIDNIIETIKKALNDDWLVYTAWSQERNRAKNISQNKQLKEIAETSWKTVEEMVYAITQLSHKTQFAKKINNAVDFHYKWAEVYNYLKTLKEEKLDKKNNFTSDNVY